MLLATQRSEAQASAAGIAPESTGHVATGLVAPVNGFNFILDQTGQHNSATGWADIVTPDLSFRFDRHFSVSALVPWYPTVNAFVPKTVNGVKTYPLATGKDLLGDTVGVGTYELPHNRLTYLATASVGFPTGNSRFGLSANTETYNINNHLDYSIGPFDPDIEVGEGNSSSLVNRAVKKPYVAVGPLANFQAGSSIDLPFSFNLDVEAYEELPIGNQSVYGTVTRKNNKGKTVTQQVLEGAGTAEDNGIVSELDFPIGLHFMLTGTYERSLRQDVDTASVGITWVARKPKITRAIE
ncbi:MAG TPA: hypothetical protein VGU25_06485 [Acidobacteriaceae bacterium]|nr:hypothetical protein [Acidobacteriaceae bacterium]